MNILTSTPASAAALMAAAFDVGRCAARLAFDACAEAVAASREERDTRAGVYAHAAYLWVGEAAGTFGVHDPGTIAEARMEALAAFVREQRRLEGIPETYEPPEGAGTRTLQRALHTEAVAAARSAFHAEFALPEDSAQAVRLQPLQHATDAVFTWVRRAVDLHTLEDEAALNWWNVEALNVLAAEYFRLREAWSGDGGRA